MCQESKTASSQNEFTHLSMVLLIEDTSNLKGIGNSQQRSRGKDCRDQKPRDFGCRSAGGNKVENRAGSQLLADTIVPAVHKSIYVQFEWWAPRLEQEPANHRPNYGHESVWCHQIWTDNLARNGWLESPKRYDKLFFADVDGICSNYGWILLSLCVVVSCWTVQCNLSGFSERRFSTPPVLVSQKIVQY